MKRRVFLLTLFSVALAGAASAQVRDRTVEISPFAGYLFGGEFARGTTDLFAFDVEADDAPTYGARLGFNLNSTFQLELQVSHTETDFVTRDNDGALFGGDSEQKFGELDIDYALVYMTFNFGRRRVVPYVTLGAGVARLKPGPIVICPFNPPCFETTPDSETRFTASLGGGIKTFFTPNFGLRFDGRGYATSLTDNANNDEDFCGFSDDCDSNHRDWLTNGEVTLGLLFAF